MPAPLSLLLVAATAAAAAAAAAPAGGHKPQRPGGSLASYFTVGDYPAEARRKREQGTVGFRIAIGPDGRVAACDVTASSGSASLDETTCRLVRQRVRFTPARDAQGRPTGDSKDLEVVWRLD